MGKTEETSCLGAGKTALFRAHTANIKVIVNLQVESHP